MPCNITLRHPSHTWQKVPNQWGKWLQNWITFAQKIGLKINAFDRDKRFWLQSNFSRWMNNFWKLLLVCKEIQADWIMRMWWSWVGREKGSQVWGFGAKDFTNAVFKEKNPEKVLLSHYYPNILGRFFLNGQCLVEENPVSWFPWVYFWGSQLITFNTDDHDWTI